MYFCLMFFVVYVETMSNKFPIIGLLTRLVGMMLIIIMMKVMLMMMMLIIMVLMLKF